MDGDSKIKTSLINLKECDPEESLIISSVSFLTSKNNIKVYSCLHSYLIIEIESIGNPLHFYCPNLC